MQVRGSRAKRVAGIALLVPLLASMAPVGIPILAAADQPLGSDTQALGDVPSLPSDLPPLPGGYNDGIYGDGAAYDDGLGDFGYDPATYLPGDTSFPGDDTTLPTTTLPNTIVPGTTPPPGATPPPATTLPPGDGSEGDPDGDSPGGGDDPGSNDPDPDDNDPDEDPGDIDPGPIPGETAGCIPDLTTGATADAAAGTTTAGAAADPAAAAADAARAMPAITTVNGPGGGCILRGGEPWWFAGYNSFVWSGNCGDPGERMSAQDVDRWFASMRHDGHGAVRLFFFAGWDMGRLDEAVASAKRHNVYLTITLDDAIGGCGETDKSAAWFTNASETATYQRHMTELLTRYKGETAIAWFEFFNEPDNYNGALGDFYDQMGKVADDIDPNRLFSSGTVAPYWVDGAPNFRDIHESTGVDIASLHEYDQGEVESNHGDDVRGNSAGKPVIVGEFGLVASPSGPCTDSNGNTVTGFGDRARRVAAKLGAYTGQGYAGAFGWAWQPGRSGCELGNLDADVATQQVFREFANAGSVALLSLPPAADLAGPIAPAEPAPVVPAPVVPAPVVPPVVPVPPVTTPPPVTTTPPTTSGPPESPTPEPPDDDTPDPTTPGTTTPGPTTGGGTGTGGTGSGTDGGTGSGTPTGGTGGAAPAAGTGTTDSATTDTPAEDAPAGG